MRKLEETIQIIENDPNGLLLCPGDEDGFHITEVEGKGRIYVYYSERERLIECLQGMGD